MPITTLHLGPVTLPLAAGASIEDMIAEGIARRKPMHVVTFNALMFDSARSNAALAEAISRADFAVADSVGICWAVHLLKGLHIDRCTGIDLLHRICSRAAQQSISVFLMGARPGVAEKAAEQLCRRYPGLIIAGTRHGYFDTAEEMDVIRSIRQSGATILFAALAMPAQEIWLSRHRDEFGATILMGVGGSFDVISGSLKRAPVWMQRLGIEWFYRLLQQPGRIGRMLRLPVFVFDIIRLKLGMLPGPYGGGGQA